MNRTQLVKKFRRGFSIAWLMLSINQLYADQYSADQFYNNSQIQIQLDGMRPCSNSQYYICSINLSNDSTYGRVTVTNTSTSSLMNIDVNIKPEISTYIFVSKSSSCSNLSPNQACIIELFLSMSPGSPDSQVVNITGNNSVLGQFQLSIE